MRGLRSFIFSLLFVLAVSSITYFLLYFILSGQKLHNPLSAPDRVQALSSILALVLGTSAAVGGALATIQTANLGFGIAERQERLDALQFLENRFQTATKLYANVLFALDRVNACGIAVDHAIPHIDRDRVIKEMKDAKPGKLAFETAALNDALLDLVRELRSLATDEFSMYCYSVASRQMNSKLKFISDTLVQLGVIESSAVVDIENVAGLCSILDICRRRVLDNTLGSLIEARTFANSSGIELFGIDYDNRSVRSLFFLGNLIFCRAETLPDGRMYIASYGAAMIRDILRAIPTDSIIRESLKARYPTLSFAVDGIKSAFRPNTIISTFAKYAIESADEIGGLYLMISKGVVSGGIHNS